MGGAAFLNDCTNVTGEYWRFVPIAGLDGYYRMQTRFLESEDKCLEGNGLGSTVLGGASFLDTCQNVTGQYWKLVDAEGGYHRLQTKLAEGDNKCLEGNRLAPESVLKGAAFQDDCQNVTGQLWKLVPTDVKPQASDATTEAPAASAAPAAVQNDQCPTGWTSCRTLADPKITIVGSRAVSKSAMDVVEHIYTEMTSRFTPAYPKNKFDGYIIYMTNGEPWSELKELAPIGTMWSGVVDKGIDRGDDLRGGTGPDYLWIDEQMICKTGIQTRNQAYEAGKRAQRDDTVRTFDQVIHEFSHAIAFRYNLGARLKTVYANGWNAPNHDEEFPWSIQHWFEAPAGKLSDSESAFISEIFSSKTTFSCDTYKP